MCLFTNARTVAIVFARSAGSEAMYCAGVLTFDGGFMDSSASRTKWGIGNYLLRKQDYLSGMRAWSQSPRREAEGLSRLHNTITDWPDSGYTRRIAFIPGAPPPWP